MDGRWLDAVDAFLDRRVPATEEPLPKLRAKPFEGVPAMGWKGSLSSLCEYSSHLGKISSVTISLIQIAAIVGWMPSLQIVHMSSKADTVNSLNLKPDISIYHRVEAVVPPGKTHLSRMELWMEFKMKNDGAAFQDPRDDTKEERLLAIEKGLFTPGTEAGNEARGQLAHYARAQHSLQFRQFSFSVVFQRDHARFL